MAEEDDSDLEKSEEPSEKKLKDAREKGQVARSKELTSMLLLSVGMIGLVIWLPSIYKALIESFSKGFVFSRDELLTPDTMINQLWEAVQTAVGALSGWFFLLILIAIFSQMLMGGVFLNMNLLNPDFSKMNPVSGLKRMFSIHAIFELVKALAKFILITLVTIWFVQSRLASIVSLGNETTHHAIEHSIEILFSAFLWICFSLVAISAIDVPFEWFRHRKKLMMSKQDMKDEYKNTEGNPEIKSRLRQIQRRLANSRMMDQVPKADVIITNPTHFSVALKYDGDTMDAPIVVAKGADLMAAAIRRIAHANDVFIVTAPPLARAIYYKGEVDKPIPKGLYLAVAQVLAYVHQLRAYRRGQGPKPSDLADVNIPAEYFIAATDEELNSTQDNNG